MTGYGRSSVNFGEKKIMMDIRSLNSKQLDVSLRIPLMYREKESDIRNEISKMIQRGKVDLCITIEQEVIDKTVTINRDLVKNYFEQIKYIADDLKIPASEEMLYAAIRMPETMRADANIPDEAEWKAVLQCLQDCIKQFNKFREQEGQALEKDMNERIGFIKQNMEKISLFDEARIKNIKDRLRKNLNEFIGQENIDKNRFEQEIIYYLEKLDINEERVRLKNHCKYFYDTMKEDNPGKKLGFISQEMGREINTIGSKANDHEIQHLVVMMKDELEKVKEQLMNVL